ncbi:3-ketoacyl-CoA synthase 20 [Citrus sinensis]|uniref:3-ketoacyl-CoA synthase n=3 Tax=Citrus TaxID=2706 RepID=V4UQL6_CITCL|nr:3-ketoacyl-CoA synthase 20 isoform X2 [Citrus x clementina]XP_006480395.1 3-ketoacyl-CoA synthase 20-like isoform X2 [Citrus sinensis]ESR41804.1 hypothetical protein CICLE_v10011503mg [Citrus x clementina]KAH9670866.1 3-ketoacyl-CoA synthase 20 [Citrus sinensis]
MANESEGKLQKDQLPNFVASAKGKPGFHYLISNALYLLLIPLFVIVLTYDLFSTLSTIYDLFQIWNELSFKFDNVTVLLLVVLCLVSLVFTTIYLMSRPKNVYLVNFSCYKPDPSRMCTRESFLQIASQTGKFSDETLDFKKKILERSGIGNMTYGPKSLMENPAENGNMEEARKETEGVIIGAVDELLAKTGVKPKAIGILVVNSSSFNPTPSLSAFIVNHYKLRSKIFSYNLGGMGCSAGLISIDLAQKLLQVEPNCYALVVSTENITLGWYVGNDRSMLLTNCLFRVGGAAILLSNRSSDRSSSKYQLVRTLRSHQVDDNSYNCIMQKEDEFQHVGVKISKTLMVVAGEALKTHITAVGPLVLPMYEQLLFLATSVARKIFKMKINLYIPDIKLAFEHFCIHTGGRGVLDGIEKNLQLNEWHMEPSRMTLNRFGNTSSSSVWYELAYSEAKRRIRKGDRICQIGFGSGFKCSTVVWRALKTINLNPTLDKNPWIDEIDNFPVQVPQDAPIAF